MKKLSVSLPSLWLASLLAAPAAAILTPGDAIFGYDLDTSNSFPAGEAPTFITDGDPSTKYLNFAKLHTGVIVTPSSGPAVAQSFTVTTANDADVRDPASYLLFGTNAPVTSSNPGTDNVSGFADDWTYIGSGGLSLPTNRLTTSAAVNFTNSSAFSSYWMVFPTVRDSGAANSMQVADLQFFTDLGAAGSAILAPGDASVGTNWDVDFPGTESPDKVLDGDTGTKYLTFGKENSGLWVVPAMGPSIVQSFTLTTANDSPERDPASFRLLGQGADGSWNLIDAGPLSLTDDRVVESDRIVVANSNSYDAYRIEFDTLKNGAGANSMQIAEIQFFDNIPEPSTSLLAAGGLLALLIRRRRR